MVMDMIRKVYGLLEVILILLGIVVCVECCYRECGYEFGEFDFYDEIFVVFEVSYVDLYEVVVVVFVLLYLYFGDFIVKCIVFFVLIYGVKLGDDFGVWFVFGVYRKECLIRW